jgi:hypothetical protein
VHYHLRKRIVQSAQTGVRVGKHVHYLVNEEGLQAQQSVTTRKFQQFFHTCGERMDVEQTESSFVNE